MILIIRNILKNIKSYSLKNLVKELKIKGGSFHRALSDAFFCMKLLLKCINELNNNNNILEHLITKNEEKSKSYNELTLCWKEILLKRGLNSLLETIEKKSDIEIKYPLIGNTYSKYVIKPARIWTIRPYSLLAIRW